LYLFDTFDGMVLPTELDVDLHGITAAERLEREQRDTSFVWAVAKLPEVKHGLESTGYPLDRIRFVLGPVEETVPAHAPGP
jgi:hypothetical protein